MKFSPGDAIRFGWEMFKGRPWFFIGAVAILLLASIAINIVSSAIDSATGGSLEEPSIAGSIVNYGLAVLLKALERETHWPRRAPAIVAYLAGEHPKLGEHAAVLDHTSMLSNWDDLPALDGGA